MRENVNNKNCFLQRAIHGVSVGSGVNIKSMEAKFVCYVCMISTKSYQLVCIVLASASEKFHFFILGFSL